jgi:hypothetical protein
VTILASDGRQVSIPISALSFDTTQPTQVIVTPSLGAHQADAQKWLNYLATIGALVPGTAPPPALAMSFTATNPGSAGNRITVTIAYPDPTQPLFNVTATETDTYTGLTPATLKAVLGTETIAGMTPGLVRALDAETPTLIPDPVTATLATTGPTVPAAVVLQSGGSNAFTLQAREVGSDGTLITVVVSAGAVAGSFNLAVGWTKTVQNVALATAASQLAALSYLVTVSAPTSGTFALPIAATLLLAGGVDSQDAQASVLASA